MLLGCIGDDFTGASDLANTLAKGGMMTIQFIGAPTGRAPRDCEAGVVALKTRSIAPEDAVARSLEALGWLRRQGCRQFLFKYCSTFELDARRQYRPSRRGVARRARSADRYRLPDFPGEWAHRVHGSSVRERQNSSVSAAWRSIRSIR